MVTIIINILHREDGNALISVNDILLAAHEMETALGRHQGLAVMHQSEHGKKSFYRVYVTPGNKGSYSHSRVLAHDPPIEEKLKGYTIKKICRLNRVGSVTPEVSLFVLEKNL